MERYVPNVLVLFLILFLHGFTVQMKMERNESKMYSI
jgi:hypothetical protein